MFKQSAFLGMVLAGWLPLITMAQQDAIGEVPITPNESVQSFLRALSSTNLQERQRIFSTGTETEFREKLEEIQNTAGGPQAFVVQLLYFQSRAKDTMAAMLPVVIVEKLGISQDDMTSALLLHLETGDASVLKEAREWLGGLDYNRVSKQYDFSGYEGILREKKQNPPQGLIRYMYGRDPRAAVLSMSRVYGDKAVETELADKLKGDPKAALQSLVDRPEWWAHLYVAETMKKEPQLRDAAILKKLEKDDNPLVKEKVAEITSGK